MNKKRKQKLLLELYIIFLSLAALALLIYFVLILSFQSGEESANETIGIAVRIAHTVFADPTEVEILTIHVVLRYMGHLGLFFIVGFVATFVSMVIFRNYYRILGVFLSCGVCYILAYYTEYYKQFIDGRHFQLFDVILNWCGSAAGIAFMVVSYFVNRLLVKLSVET